LRYFTLQHNRKKTFVQRRIYWLFDAKKSCVDSVNGETLEATVRVNKSTGAT
jgi:hypothetical protein